MKNRKVCMILENLKYTKDHEWVMVENGVATIGITDYAQKQLGDITFVELPEKNSLVNEGDSFCTVESVKAASDVYAPVTGEVIEVNVELEEAPELINQEPYGKGWICHVKIANIDEFNNLMNFEEYKNIIEG